MSTCELLRHDLHSPFFVLFLVFLPSYQLSQSFQLVKLWDIVVIGSSYSLICWTKVFIGSHRLNVVCLPSVHPDCCLHKQTLANNIKHGLLTFTSLEDCCKLMAC